MASGGLITTITGTANLPGICGASNKRFSRKIQRSIMICATEPKVCPEAHDGKHAGSDDPVFPIPVGCPGPEGLHYGHTARNFSPPTSRFSSLRKKKKCSGRLMNFRKSNPYIRIDMTPYPDYSPVSHVLLYHQSSGTRPAHT